MDKFQTFEAYLDDKITDQDLDYLEDRVFIFFLNSQYTQIFIDLKHTNLNIKAFFY